MRALCAVQDCGREQVARGYCDKHYRRLKAHGSPHVVKKAGSGEPLQWLKDHTGYEGDACLLWPFSKMRGGYGHLQVEGTFHPAHRYMCLLVYGVPPSELHQAAHSCGQGHLGCVNPKHLRWATPAENIHDALVHGTMPTGERHYQTRLTEAEVRTIRLMHSQGIVQRRIAERFNLSPQRVNEIVKRKAWKYVA